MSALSEDIKKKLEKAFESGGLRDKGFEVTPCTVSRRKNSYKGYLITYTQMYEAEVPDGYNFLSFCEKIREISGLQQVDLVGNVSEGGCETCDYGSSYGWNFYVWDGGLE